MDNLSATYFRFMASTPGRWLRGALGGTMIVGGFADDGPGGILFSSVGLIPLVAAGLDLCLPAPLWKLPLQGVDLRRKLRGPTVSIRGPQSG